MKAFRGSILNIDQYRIIPVAILKHGYHGPWRPNMWWPDLFVMYLSTSVPILVRLSQNPQQVSYAAPLKWF
jgi:hypothetical protein